MADRPKVTVIGGGTGSFTVLSGLKRLDIDLTALVNMVDDGGSTGQLRDDYGVLPPGDVRQCLVALSDAPMPVRNLFNFRFPGDSKLGGHSFGNLFLSAVEMMNDNFSDAVLMASNILNIKGRVLPVTTEKCQLAVELDTKETIGQQKIDNLFIKKGSKPNIFLNPRAKLNPEAKLALEESNLIVIAPGSLYSSIIPALIVDGMVDVLRRSSAKTVLICNLVNKPNHTYGFRITDYLQEIDRFIGTGVIDYVLYNKDIPKAYLLKRYTDEDEFPVEVDTDNFHKYGCSFVEGSFLEHKIKKQDKNDTLLKRSLIRHNSEAVADAVKLILSYTI